MPRQASGVLGVPRAAIAVAAVSSVMRVRQRVRRAAATIAAARRAPPLARTVWRASATVEEVAHAVAGCPGRGEVGEIGIGNEAAAWRRAPGRHLAAADHREVEPARHADQLVEAAGPDQPPLGLGAVDEERREKQQTLALEPCRHLAGEVDRVEVLRLDHAPEERHHPDAGPMLGAEGPERGIEGAPPADATVIPSVSRSDRKAPRAWPTVSKTRSPPRTTRASARP